MLLKIFNVVVNVSIAPITKHLYIQPDLYGILTVDRLLQLHINNTTVMTIKQTYSQGMSLWTLVSNWETLIK